MPLERFISIAAVIGIALVVLLIVVVVIALRQRSPGPAKHQAAPADKPAPEWVKNVAGTTGKALTRTGRTALPVNAILVLRDPVSNDWLVEINGMRYRHLNEIHDDRAADKVLEALSGLQRFAGTIPIVSPDLKPAQPMAAQAQPQPETAKPAAQPVPATTTKMEPTVAAALSQTGPQPSKPVYPAVPNSILDQIEKVLQRNLLQHPELAKRRIHVGAAADGSLLVEVDRQFYSRPDDVPDPVVRNIIKSYIREWERTA